MADTRDVPDETDEPLSDAESRDRRNRFVMAGSVAPKNAGWLFPKIPRTARRRAFACMGLSAVVIGLLALTNNGRLGAYAVLLAFGLYVVFVLALLVRFGLARRRR